MDTQKAIESGKTVLGVEFGSTRIKSVLIGEDHVPIASGSHEWENRYENGIWTYSLEDVWAGLQDSYRKLSGEVLEKYGTPAPDHWRHWLQCHDARLHGLRSG